jgi:hypothetical protein
LNDLKENIGQKWQEIKSSDIMKQANDQIDNVSSLVVIAK